jgi:hypothetical protein
MAPERPRPNLEETREALRRHDERVEEDQESAEDSAPEPEEGEEEEPAE